MLKKRTILNGWICREEKETDVSIGIKLVEDAYEKISDRILLITNDSDQSPAIRMALEKNTNLKIDVISPPLKGKQKPSISLQIASRKTKRSKSGKLYYQPTIIKEIHLERSLFPSEISLHDGNKIIRPAEYTK